ncbi:MAG: hypothetical protein FDX30_10045 [Chlorobium sp.]|nr:MAG: hypothetical protein FDX30_10045 [Chlorobium sp.]
MLTENNANETTRDTAKKNKKAVLIMGCKNAYLSEHPHVLPEDGIFYNNDNTKWFGIIQVFSLGI